MTEKEEKMAHKKCPNCAKKINWRNDEFECKECGKQFCKECANYGMMGMSLRCPNCKSGKVSRIR